ncbi:MAG: vanadium-dependent haloperoxidase [Saprospiraceae bacterium]|nr:vanadium-dependent haloperoxidase [Saprospiraceae bacterium]
MKLNSLFWLVFFVFSAFGCQEQINENYQTEAANPQFIHQSMKKLTDVIVHDIFSPPVASRIYAYASIAAYEALQPAYESHTTLAGQLTDFQEVPQPIDGDVYCFPLASVHAFLIVGKALIFSEQQIEEYEKEVYAQFEAMKMPKAVYERSLAYGKIVGEHVLAWSKSDNYKQTRTFPKYSITDDPGRWKPTPPAYMDGIEPHWNKIRPMVLDSAQQFAPAPPTPFSMEKDSKFYEEVMVVYHALNDEATKMERLAIASFWDCNPYVSHHKGHVMFATKKITPGGHWMGIAKIAAEKANANVMESVEAYAKTAIALMDGFISCWDEKYRSNLIRPETVINTYIDPNWAPALQTPPFPEYTSGHSVISRAAAIALTSLFGDNFAFDDNTEEEYGLPTRSFNSFLQAAEEAAVSRIYGGIHYPPACEEGVVQGEKVGNLVVSSLQMRSSQLGMN